MQFPGEPALSSLAALRTHSLVTAVLLYARAWSRLLFMYLNILKPFGAGKALQIPVEGFQHEVFSAVFA